VVFPAERRLEEGFLQAVLAFRKFTPGILQAEREHLKAPLSRKPDVNLLENPILELEKAGNEN
jgi:hypothetical protein